MQCSLFFIELHEYLGLVINLLSYSSRCSFVSRYHILYSGIVNLLRFGARLVVDHLLDVLIVVLLGALSRSIGQPLTQLRCIFNLVRYDVQRLPLVIGRS